MSMIAIVPIGRIEKMIIDEIETFIESYYSKFRLKAETFPSLPLKPFSTGFNPVRGQYLGRVFLPTLSSIGKRVNAVAVLGVTDADLYEDGLNFIFGLANPSLGAAIISLHRLKPEFYGNAPDERLLAERAVKEAMHELGHVFGLDHCPNPGCVMHFSNSILDTDLKGPLYCPACEEKLSKNLGVLP